MNSAMTQPDLRNQRQRPSGMRRGHQLACARLNHANAGDNTSMLSDRLGRLEMLALSSGPHLISAREARCLMIHPMPHLW